MDRLFLDANVLFSAEYREDAGVRRLWKLPDAVLLTSQYAVEEARRNLPDRAQLLRIELLLESVEVVGAGVLEPDRKEGVTLPDKDWPILSGAVVADATHLITGDLQDFGRYFGERPLGVLVLPPAMYLAQTE